MLLRPTSMKIGLDNRVKLIISFKVSKIGLESSESSNSSGMTLEAFRSIAGKLRCDATMEPLGIDDNLLQINQLNDNVLDMDHLAFNSNLGVEMIECLY